MVMAVKPPHNIVEDDAAEADVVIVCVTYNSEEIIEPWLRAVAAAVGSVGSCRVVITDNGSSDATPAMIRELAPWANLITPGRNLGYSAGINAAIRFCSARRGIYVLNPDAIPAPGSVAVLADAAESDPAVGIVVPRVKAVDGELKFSLRREPTILRATGEALLGGHRASQMSWFGDQIRDMSAYYDGATSDWATGAAMFISREVIDQVGEWDERFFLYSEETDYALRARDAGFSLRLAARATVTHPGGEMETAPRLWAICAVNRTRLYRKRHSALPSGIYWAVVLLNELIRAACGRQRSRNAAKALLRAGPSCAGPESTLTIIRSNDKWSPAEWCTTDLSERVPPT